MKKYFYFFIWFTLTGTVIAAFLIFVLKVELRSIGEVALITFFTLVAGIPTKLWFDKAWEQYDDQQSK